MGRDIATQDIATVQPIETPAADVASVRARTGGYVVDMIILAAVALIMFVIGFGILLASSDWAKNDPPNSAYYGALAIVGLGTPLVWSLMNLLLLATRSQTAGQYVAGIRLAREDGERLRLRSAAAWWFALNPALFSWPMACVTLLPLAATAALALNKASTALVFTIAALCIVAPAIALVSALLDRENRTLYDRLAGTIVVPGS
jgi:uncharacterized RDD family membrane protein YckC